MSGHFGQCDRARCGARGAIGGRGEEGCGVCAFLVGCGPDVVVVDGVVEGAEAGEGVDGYGVGAVGDVDAVCGAGGGGCG